MSVRPTTTTVTRLSSIQFRLNWPAKATVYRAQAKMARPMPETTARKMFDARLSFDGCDIVLSWYGRGAVHICESPHAEHGPHEVAQAHSGGAGLGEGGRHNTCISI